MANNSASQLGRGAEDDERDCKDGIRRQEIIVAWWLMPERCSLTVASGLLPGSTTRLRNDPQLSSGTSRFILYSTRRPRCNTQKRREGAWLRLL